VNSLIVTTATRGLVALMLVFSIFALLRGHNEPGGGFVGGLIAAASLALYAIAFGVEAARRTLRVEPRTLIAVGLLTALASGVVGFLRSGAPFLTGVWDQTPIPVIGKLGTPLVFDVGVYLVVTGVTLTIVFTLAEEDQ
jgi:multicomponent Na+:H+ antiporter subunit B